MRHHLTIHLPPLRALTWQFGRHLLEAALVPAGLFYLLLTFTDFFGAVLAALGWSVAAIGYRLVRRSPVPMVLLITTGLLVARTVVGLVSGDAFLYFLQPTMQNFLVAAAFLATAPLQRPVLARLADEFCAFPDDLSGHPLVRRFFQRVSLLWALVFLVNGAATLAALATTTVGQFLLVSTAGSYALVVLGAAGSWWWFRRVLRSGGIRLRIGAPAPAAAMPVPASTG